MWTELERSLECRLCLDLRVGEILVLVFANHPMEAAKTRPGWRERRIDLERLAIEVARVPDMPGVRAQGVGPEVQLVRASIRRHIAVQPPLFLRRQCHSQPVENAAGERVLQPEDA